MWVIKIFCEMKNILLIISLLASSAAFASTEINEIGGAVSTTVSAFPNPATDRLFVNVNSNSSNSAIRIKMYDVLGKIVLNKEGNDTDGAGKSNNVIDVNEFFPGIYTVVISDEFGQNAPPVSVMVTR